MKPSKGLSSDHKKLEQPEGTYPFGKNGMWNANTNSIQNEKGFRVSNTIFPYQVNGVIETDSDPIFFSTNDTYSAFGFYREATDSYEPIEDDQFKPYKLNFRKDKYIKGEARRNYRNNIEIAFIDKLNPVRFADTANLPDSLKNYLIFPEYYAPKIQVDIVNGGVLGMGAYFVTARYLNDDGTETRYTTPTPPMFATAPNFSAIPGGSTGKSLKVTLTGLDTQYTYVRIAIIKRVNGITTVVELPKVTVTDPITVTFSGTEGEDITLEEVLIPAAFYNNAGSITQLNDILYLADITESQILSLQKYANLVRLRWKSDLRLNISTDDDVKSGKVRTLKHGEAYAAFIVYELTNGQFTDGFHCPGIAPTLDDLSLDPGVTFVAPKFQTNTRGIAEINTADRTGRPGVWVNEEVYPNIPEFNSSDIGGEDLRGKRVRHHKMPTLNQTLTMFYTGEAGFGSNGLDALGITAENVIIPPELQGMVVGYELYFAKRDYSNATILSQGLVINPARSGYTGNDRYFTGGNFSSRMRRSDFSSSDSNRQLNISWEHAKLNHPDLLVNRPAITPTYLASNYVIRATIYQFNSVTANTVDEMNFLVNYYNEGSRISQVYTIKEISTAGYILNNGSFGPVKNIKSEDGYLASLKDNGFTLASVDLLIRNGRQTEGTVHVPTFEPAHLADVVVVKTDIYKGFTTMDLVRTGVINSMDMTEPRKYSFSGDCFLVLHSYWSYGLTDSVDRYPSNPGKVDGIDNQETDTYTDEYFRGSSGVHVARQYVTESSINMWQRYVDPALPTSKFHPASPAETMNGMDRNRDNNTIAVSKDASSVGDLLNGIKPYNFEQVNIERSPYKIIRSSKQDREGKRNSWKNYNALDYYETDKNMGPIINLLGFDDRLLIHHRNALFITQDKTTLQGDILAVTLGTGDIFRMPPRQGKPSKTGYAGTQHQLACMLTDYGYVFPDAETGVWFVFNSQGLNEMNLDMYNFFEEYLNIPEINPFIGNGICVGYDRRYKRVLVTVKNIKLIANENYVPNYEETPAFFAQLIPGVSIVFKDGRYQLFKGVNTSEFSCTVYPAPVLGNYVFTIPEDSPPSFFVGDVTATGDEPLSYLIIGGNVDGAFSIDSVTGNIVVANQAALNVLLRSHFDLVVKVVDTHGGSDTGSVTVNMTAIAKPPITQDYILNVDENVPVNTLIQMVMGVDPKGLPLTWSIDSQSIAGAVKINAATGALSVNDPTVFNFEVNTIIEVVVRVSNGGLFALSNVRILIQDVNEAPAVHDYAATILDTKTGLVLTFDEAIDPETDGITYSVISQSVPNAFLINPVTREITVGSVPLDPASSIYNIVIRATDDGDPSLYADFNINITVLYDPALLSNTPLTFDCLAPAIIGEDGIKRWLTNVIRSSRYPGRDVLVYNNINPAGTFQTGTAGQFGLAYYPNESNSASCPVEKPLVNIHYVIAFGFDPIVWNGLVVRKNSVEIARILAEQSGDISGVRIGDSLNIRQVSFPDNFPWPPSPTVRLRVVNNATEMYNDTRTAQVIELQDYTYVVPVGTTDVYIYLTGSSTVEGYKTYTLTTDIAVAQDDVRARIDDLTGPALAVDVLPKPGFSAFSYNLIDDVAQQKVTVTNQSATPQHIKIEGVFGYLYEQDLGPSATLIKSDLPKGAVHITVDNDVTEEVGNELRQQTYQRDNCAEGSSGTFYTYRVEPNTHYAADQAAANALADADLLENGQNEANANAICILDTVISVLVVDIYDDPTLDICFYIDTVGVDPTVNQQPVSRIDNFFKVGVPPENAYLLASDVSADPTLKYRFQANIGKLIADYPDAGAMPLFTFKLRGRASASGTKQGVYALKYPNQTMIMNGSEGTYMPSITPAGGPTPTVWGGPGTAGADGSIGLSVGAVIVTFVYDRAANTIYYL